LSATKESHKEIHENADVLNEQHNDLTTNDHKLSTDFKTISPKKNTTNYITQNVGNEDESEEIKHSSGK
jgi:peptidoglycan hydrolase CwlO-like protein